MSKGVWRYDERRRAKNKGHKISQDKTQEYIKTISKWKTFNRLVKG